MALTPDKIKYYKEHASDSLQPSLLASNIAGLSLAYIGVALRVWARRTAKTRLASDDWLIFAALVPLTTYGVVGFLQVSFGEGKHIIFVTNVAGFVQGYVTCITAYALCVVLTKLSILCFYCRIFSPHQSLSRIAWGLGVFIIAYNVALIFVAAFQCVPLSSMWKGTQGKCIDTLPPYTVLGIINVVTDVAILVLPIRFVLQLHMALTRRIQICVIFLLGSVVCVFGIVRVVALARAPAGDPSYNQVWSGVWSFCEIAIGIVAACLPTLAVLVTRAHLSAISTSAIGLISSTFSRRSRNSNDSRSRAQNDSKLYSDGNHYAQLSEWPLPSKVGDPSDRIYQGTSNQRAFATSNVIERGGSGNENTSGIMIKNEVVQTIH